MIFRWLTAPVFPLFAPTDWKPVLCMTSHPPPLAQEDLYPEKRVFRSAQF